MGDLTGEDRSEEATMHRKFTGHCEGWFDIFWLFGRGLITCSIILVLTAVLFWSFWECIHMSFEWHEMKYSVVWAFGVVSFVSLCFWKYVGFNGHVKWHRNVGPADDLTLLNSSVSSPIWCLFRTDTAIKIKVGHMGSIWKSKSRVKLQHVITRYSPLDDFKKLD